MIGAASSATNVGDKKEIPNNPTPTSTLNPATSSGGGFLGSIGMMTKDGPLGTASAPIHMVSSEGGLKIQAWRTLRTLALGFLLLSGVGALIEDRGISKGANPVGVNGYIGTLVLVGFSYFDMPKLLNCLKHLHI